VKRGRDRLVVLGAIVVLIALAATVVGLVLEAQQRGITTREDLRLEQIGSEANRMDALLQASFASLATVSGAPGAWNLSPRDPADAAKLEPQNPASRTGQVLVDRDGTIVNGSLLRAPHLIGSTVEREGLDDVIGGKIAVLPVGEGITTSLPTIVIGVPVRNAAGALAGAVLSEVEAAPNSPFNLFIDDFSSSKTIELSYVDPNGVVIASSNHAAIAKPMDIPAAKGFDPGFHRSHGKIAAIAAVPSASWSLVFVQDTDEFQGDLTGPLQTALLLFLGAVAAIGVFTAVALLRRLQAAREEQRRLREIGDAREEFTSIVSHELRTPVAGVLGFLQTTVDHWEAMNDPERRRAVTRAFTNARSLQTLTNDVLDSASIEARTLTYRFEPIDVRSCVSDAIETMQEASPERAIAFTKPTEPVLVRADALRIGQVLGNLLENAVKSSAPDSAIDVDVTTDGKMATVSVRDRGAGIDPDEREHIFEKFTRGRVGVGRGTGLGLYIARHIVEAHGGMIDAESVPGEPGARLRFTLPLVS
jgi:signal transduction histidine kinase